MPSKPIVTFAEYLKLPRAPETWILEGLLPVGGSMMLSGPAKLGKSYAALQLAMTVSGQGDPFWFGIPRRQTGTVVYVQLDTPRSLWADRGEKLLAQGYPIETVCVADRGTLETWPFDILNPDHYQLLHAALKVYDPVLVIMDTMRESSSAEENSSTELPAAVNKLIAVSQPATLVLIHHTRKPGESTEIDIVHDSRGTSAVPAKMDALCQMTKKGLHYVGRSIEESFCPAKRDQDSGLWFTD